MQYDIDGGNITVIVGEEARIDVPTALNYIKSGQAEIGETVDAGIDAFDLNAANKTTAYDNNASAKLAAYNDNATDKLNAFNLNASGKTTDFNDNYTLKKAAVDASADAAAASATLAQAWAVKMDGKVADEDYSAKYYADLASQAAGATGANIDLSNLSPTGEAKFEAKQDVINDLSDIRSGAALGATAVQPATLASYVTTNTAQTITGAKTFSGDIILQNNFYHAKSTNIAYTETPTGSNKYLGLDCVDKNGYQMSAHYMAYYTDGRIFSGINLHNKAGGQSALGIEVDAQGDFYGISPAPRASSATSKIRNEIATVAWVNTSGNNVVHLDSTETITGTKLFTTDIYRKNNNLTKGTAPSSNTNAVIAFADKNNVGLGHVYHAYMSNKDSRTILQASKANSSSDTATASLGICYPASGNPYAYAPNSDVNGSILTTVNKSKAANGYFRLGNGMIVQWGTSSTSNSSGVFTLPTAFTSTNYAVVMNSVLANVPPSQGSNANVVGWGVVQSRTTTNFTAFLCNYENSYWWRDAAKTVTWIAIGY